MIQPTKLKAKRGQKRNRRQRRAARAQHRVMCPRVRPVREGPPCEACGGSGETAAHDFGGAWEEAGACFACVGTGYLCCMGCGVDGVAACPQCERQWRRDMEEMRQHADTLHVSDIPRVGQRARERSARARFGGAW